MAKEIPIDRGETPTLDQLSTMPEAQYRFLTMQKFDKIFDIASGHERRVTVCENTCAPWHQIVLKWLIGLVLLVGGTSICYVAYLVTKHSVGV